MNLSSKFISIHVNPLCKNKIIHTLGHNYHLVDESPWPLIASIGGITITSGLVQFFHFNRIDLFILGILITTLTASQWWINVRQEGTLKGQHTKFVLLGLKWGIVLFIASEVLFFRSFFWAFFHSSLSVNIELGRLWPPKGISPFNPFSVPLLNTIILISSGVSVTHAHHRIIAAQHSKAIITLTITLLLGLYFTILQALEYYEASFTFADSIYGSSFFLATGFHGLHVIVGSLFLAVTLLRLRKGNLRINHHFGFEAAAWYWHFVDVVWLFLFIRIYWWGGA